MICMPLFKRSLFKGLKVMLPFLAILAMYYGVIIYMFDPEMAEMLDQFQEILPQMMSAVGMSGIATNLIEFIGVYLYGFLMLIVPMIFTIIIVNSSIVKYVDSGSMAMLLATPNSRYKIILTQALAMVLNIAIFIGLITVFGYAYSEMFFANQLNVEIYLKLNFSCLLIHLLLASICFLAGCVFNDSKGYMLVGVGLPIIFILANMLSNMGDNLAFFKYFSLFTLFPKDAIIANESAFLMNLIMFSSFIVIMGISFKYFQKKDLSL